MIWKRRGRIIGILILAQLGIIACYQMTQSGNAAPFDPPAAPRTEKPAGSPACSAPGLPVPNLPVGNAFPIAMEGSVPPPVAAKVPPPIVSESSPGNGNYLETKEPTPAAPEKKADPAPPTPPPAPSPPVPSSTIPAPAAAPPPPEPAAPPAVPVMPNDRPPQDLKTVSPPTSPALPVPNPTPPAPAPVEKAAVRCPWILRVEIVEGRTQLTAETSKDIQFRLSCERLNLQAPSGSIEAHGAVKLTSPGIEGTCDQLTITWQDDHVVLKGQAQMKCRRDGQDLELKSDQLSLRLSGARIVHSAPAEESEPPAVDRRTTTRIGGAKHPRSED